MIRTVQVTRYVTPLREGGSVPAVVEADDEGTYVLKFRGAGQGRKVLIAELLAGEIGRQLGLPVPEIVFAQLDSVLGRSEPDPELQGPILASAGLNLALDFLPGAFGFDPLADPPDAGLAAEIVWFDAFVTNVDRTPRNPNLLTWHRKLWLIDHGAALYIQHTWHDYRNRSTSRFPQIRDHVLLPFASDLRAADERLSARLSEAWLAQLVDTIPDDWLDTEAQFADSAAQRAAYVEYLSRRLAPPRAFVEEAINARAALV